jgi:hypothetical protein
MSKRLLEVSNVYILASTSVKNFCAGDRLPCRVGLWELFGARARALDLKFLASIPALAGHNSDTFAQRDQLVRGNLFVLFVQTVRPVDV